MVLFYIPLNRLTHSLIEKATVAKKNLIDTRHTIIINVEKK